MKKTFTMMAKPGDTSGAVDLYEVVRGIKGGAVSCLVACTNSEASAKQYAKDLTPAGYKTEIISPGASALLGDGLYEEVDGNV